jgi:hypothetical protein
MANLPAYTPRANETSYVQAQHTPPVPVKKTRIRRCGSMYIPNSVQTGIDDHTDRTFALTRSGQRALFLHPYNFT